MEEAAEFIHLVTVLSCTVEKLTYVRCEKCVGPKTLRVSPKICPVQRLIRPVRKCHLAAPLAPTYCFTERVPHPDHYLSRRPKTQHVQPFPCFTIDFVSLHALRLTSTRSVRRTDQLDSLCTERRGRADETWLRSGDNIAISCLPTKLTGRESRFGTISGVNKCFPNQPAGLQTSAWRCNEAACVNKPRVE